MKSQHMIVSQHFQITCGMSLLETMNGIYEFND